MRLTRLLPAIVLVTLVVSALCISLYPSFQDFMETNGVWNGVRAFAYDFGSTDINTLADLPDSPGNSILLVVPCRSYDETELSSIQRYVNGGGTLLLMDDYGFGNQVLEHLGSDIRFSNQTLLDPVFCYQNQTMPRITDSSSVLKQAGVESVVLNRATVLTGVSPEKASALSSEASFLDLNNDGQRQDSEPVGPFSVAVSFRLGIGNVALISDPSVIINTMFSREGNRQFVTRMSGFQRGVTSVIIDASHLPKASLDENKERLTQASAFLGSPYVLVALVAAIFLGAFRFIVVR
jgi:hypothetical protein